MLLRAMFFPSRIGLLASCKDAHLPHLIFILVWIAAVCGLGSASSAQPVELQEVLFIDGFWEISDITVGQDESIYIADPRGFALSRYDSQGRLIHQVGSQGVAPGEFVK